ncbi:MAG: tetratricopeptide repeat protein [Flammeovirgaceae bacterium]|nr:tetratricopeptide repeat protein [Flammeovirgaceae bacterium]
MCILLFRVTGQSQDRDTWIIIAREYQGKGEKEKALDVYQTLAKSPENIPLIHNDYLELLLDLGRFKDAEDYAERAIKRYNEEIPYKLDLGRIFLAYGDATKADRYFKSIIKMYSSDIYRTKTISDYFTKHRMVEYAIMAMLQARETTMNSNLYTLELANLYRIQGAREQMVSEYLNYVIQTPGNLNYIKNLLQVLLTKPEELESLEGILLSRVQQYPNMEVYADLLIWVNLQQKNFYGAYIQARAYDRKFRKENSKTLEIAQISLNNKDFENADRSFAYVIREFSNTDNYLPARLGRIQAREEKIKNRFPVEKDSLREIISEYEAFAKAYPNDASSNEAVLSEALLHAYYLDEKDSAIFKLNKLIGNPRASNQLKSKAKLELGDIYLLKEEPWEATLLYSQVEKTQKETILGYEAKLKNAKLSYYKGDFQLAMEHLDILKAATSREISNDAMELSIRIFENITFDSTGTDLKEYASIELLLLQNKIDEALVKLDEFKRAETKWMTSKEASALRLTPVQAQGDSVLVLEQRSFGSNERIITDVYWLEANLRLKRGEFVSSISLLQQILDKHSADVLADDAYFLQGEIYEQQLKDNEKAMEIYRDFLDQYPGSVFAAEARKRYRFLRGDFVENPNP